MNKPIDPLLQPAEAFADYLADTPPASMPAEAMPPTPARASASAGRTNRRTCTWPARRPTSTTSPSSPARCMRRSACRRSRTAG